MIELKGSRKGILEIMEKNPQEEEFFLKVKPGKFLFAALLSGTRVKRVLVSQGIERTITGKVRRALLESGVELRVEKLERGRKRKVEEWEIRKAAKEIKAGKSLGEIAEGLGISRTWLCIRLRNYKRKNSKRGRYVLPGGSNKSPQI